MFVQTMWGISGRPAPFRISSTDKGGQVKPGVYTLLEDIVAVDGGAGRPYREALEARYCASPRFRKLMRDLSLFWSISALLIGGACTVVVCVHSVSRHVAYGVGTHLIHDPLILNRKQTNEELSRLGGSFHLGWNLDTYYNSLGPRFPQKGARRMDNRARNDKDGRILSQLRVREKGRKRKSRKLVSDSTVPFLQFQRSVHA
jgi:hypothetical protein